MLRVMWLLMNYVCCLRYILPIAVKKCLQYFQEKLGLFFRPTFHHHPLVDQIHQRTHPVLEKKNSTTN